MGQYYNGQLIGPSMFGKVRSKVKNYATDEEEVLDNAHDLKELEIIHGIEEALVHVFGTEIWDDGYRNTAHRVLHFWQEFGGKQELDFNFTTFEATTGQMIVVRDIHFSSLCSHHLAPFFGKAHVAYLPNRLQVGLSKIPRLVQFWSKRPQVQEQLTEQIAKDLEERLDAKGVGVVVDATHTCMSCRGIEAHTASMVTSCMKGNFLMVDSARSEFLRLVGGL